MAATRRVTATKQSLAGKPPNADTQTKAERIWQVVHAIPVGKVCTYGEVARRAGLPGYARYVGTTLSKLPEGSALPWFRVLNSQGKVSFPVGSDAYRRQVKHLTAEGIDVHEGKVDLKRYFWQT